MKKYLIQIIYIIPIILFTPFIAKGYNKSEWVDHSLIQAMALTGGAIGISIIVLSIINWICYFLSKKELLLHSHSISILLYGYIQTLYIFSYRPVGMVNFRAHEIWITTINVTVVLITNLILYILPNIKSNKA